MNKESYNVIRIEETIHLGVIGPRPEFFNQEIYVDSIKERAQD